MTTYEMNVCEERNNVNLQAIAEIMIETGVEHKSTPCGMMVADVDGISLFDPKNGDFLEHVTTDTWLTSSLDTPLHLVRVVQLPDASRTCRVVKVFFNTEVSEYVCKLFISGGHYEPADYFTDDKADAISTAKLMAKGQ